MSFNYNYCNYSWRHLWLAISPVNQFFAPMLGSYNERRKKPMDLQHITFFTSIWQTYRPHFSTKWDTQILTNVLLCWLDSKPPLFKCFEIVNPSGWLSMASSILIESRDYMVRINYYYPVVTIYTQIYTMHNYYNENINKNISYYYMY